MLGASWKSTENSVFQRECFTLSTVFIRFVEPEISVSLRVCCDASEVALFVGSSCGKQKQLKFATWKSLSKILPSNCECSVYCFNGLYRLCRTRDISVVTQSFQLHSGGWTGVTIQNIQFSQHVPVSSIAKVAIVLCYCSVFEKLIVSSKSLIEVLEKFFECLETRTSILETRYSKLEPRNSMLDSQKLRGSRIEFRVETVNLHFPGTVGKTQRNNNPSDTNRDKLDENNLK